MATQPPVVGQPRATTRPTGRPRGGNTVLGHYATPGWYDAKARGITPRVGPIQGGWSSGGRMGGSGGRVNMTPGAGGGTPLSAATGRGLADFYAGNALDSQGNRVIPGEWERLQQRATAQQNWLNGGNTVNDNIFNQGSKTFAGLTSGQGSNISTGSNPQWNPFTGTINMSRFGGSNTFGGMTSGQGFDPNSVQWRQKGGPVEDVQPYIVNEEGVEAYQPKGGRPMLIPGPMQMFFPPKDGKIIPHKETMKMMGKEMGTKAPKPRQFGGLVRSSVSQGGGGGNTYSGPVTGRFMQPTMGMNGGPAPSNIFPFSTMGQPMQMGGMFANPFGGRQFSMNTVQFRARGGEVQGSSFAQTARNPWAAKWANRRASISQNNDYNSLYQQGLNAGINMTNAPRSISGLQRYLDMGNRSISAHSDAREAARRSLAQSAEREQASFGAPTFLSYGTGSVTNTPQPSFFANEQGEMLPWSVPVGSEQTTWGQDRALRQAQARSARSASGRPITYQEFSLEDFIQ